MERRTFLLGLVGGLAAAAGLVATGSKPANAVSLDTAGSGGATEPADIKPEDLDGVRTEDAQYWRRRRYWRRRYWGPRRRYWRRRYWGPRRRYWRRRYYWGPRRRRYYW
jgi:hypothetical protein